MVTTNNEESVRESSATQRSRHWQTLVGAFVALGCLVTAAYAVAETFWG